MTDTRTEHEQNTQGTIAQYKHDKNLSGLLLYLIFGSVKWHSKYSAILSKIHSYRLFFGDFAHWERIKQL